MALSSILSRLIPKKNKANRFFGLALRESSAIGYAFEQSETDIEVLKTKQYAYSKSFDKVLDDTDAVVYDFETALKWQFRKVIFVLPVCGLKGDGKEVTHPYRTVISEIVHNLELEAMGYVEMTDVLQEDLAPHSSSVYIEVGKLKTHIVFLRNGEKWNQLSINTNPANVASHLTEYITKGTDIYIYQIHDAVNTNALAAALSDYVVHVCKTDDINIGLAHLLKKQLITDTINTKVDEVKTSTQQDVASPCVEEQIETVPSVATDTSIVIDSQAMKVEEGKPASVQVEAPIVPEDPNSIEGFKIFPTTKLNRAEEGYVHQPPVVASITPELHRENNATYDPFVANHAIEEPSDEMTINENEREDQIDNDIGDNMPANTPKRLTQKAPLLKSVGFAFGIIVSICLAAIIVFELSIHKVTVKITVPTEKYSIKQALTAIPVTKVVEEKEVDVSVDTTGEKEVGERAKGTVIIASFDDKQASFSAGTLLYVGDAVYKLDADVQLPPATVDTVSGTKLASKKTANASATFIGTDGNIEKGKQLEIEDYSSSLYYALTDSSFTGGTQQTVSIVSEDDIDKLNDLVTEVAKQASESAKSGASGHLITLDDISTVDTEELSYSSALGEVASVIRAEGRVKAVLYTIQKKELNDKLRGIVRQDKGKGVEFLNTGWNYVFSNIELSEDELTCTFDLEVDLDTFKALDVSSIKKSIRLNPIGSASETLQKKFNVLRAEYMFEPLIPLFRLFIPYRIENIGVEIDPVGSSMSP